MSSEAGAVLGAGRRMPVERTVPTRAPAGIVVVITEVPVAVAAEVPLTVVGMVSYLLPGPPGETTDGVE
ncbi:hypothetical protein [Streptomyces broussonetiae]